MIHPPRLAAASLATALLLAASTPTAAQLPSAEQRAYDAVERARAAFESAGGRDAMLQAASQILDSAERALNAFNASERGRESAHDRFHSARDRRASAVAHAAYGQLLGIPGGADHYRASNAHIAAIRTVVDSLGRAARTLSTAARRLTDGNYPGTRASEVLRAVAALDRAASVPTVVAGEFNIESLGGDRGLAGRFNAATDELIVAARETFTVLQSHVQLVEQAARRAEGALASRDAVDGGGPGVGSAPTVQSEPADDLAGWVRAINDAAAEANRAADEAEQAAAGSGSWFSRMAACWHAGERVTQATSRVQDLTFGMRRPEFIPSNVGSEAWDQLRPRLDEADRRAAAACRSIINPLAR